MSDQKLPRGLATIVLVLGLVASILTIYGWMSDQGFVAKNADVIVLSDVQRYAMGLWVFVKEHWTIGPTLSAIIILAVVTATGVIVSEIFLVDWADELLPYLGFAVLFSPFALAWIALFHNDVGLGWTVVFAISYLGGPILFFFGGSFAVFLILERYENKELVGEATDVHISDVHDHWSGHTKQIEIMVRNVDDQQDVKVVYVGQSARAKLPTIEVGDTVSAVGKWSKGLLVASTLKRSRPRKPKKGVEPII